MTKLRAIEEGLVVQLQVNNAMVEVTNEVTEVNVEFMLKEEFDRLNELAADGVIFIESVDADYNHLNNRFYNVVPVLEEVSDIVEGVEGTEEADEPAITGSLSPNGNIMTGAKSDEEPLFGSTIHASSYKLADGTEISLGDLVRETFDSYPGLNVAQWNKLSDEKRNEAIDKVLATKELFVETTEETHTITSEDLANNPALVEDGVKEGDTVVVEDATADEMPDELKDSQSEESTDSTESAEESN